MYLKKLPLFFAFLCALACNSSTQNTNASKSVPDSLMIYTGTFEKALHEARTSSRHLVVILTKKDCPPCDVLQEYVKKDFAIRRYANDFIFYHYDETLPSASWMNQCFFITGSPTAIIFSPDGALTTIIAGSRKDIYPKVLDGVLSKDTSAMYAGSKTRASIEGAVLIQVLNKSYRALRETGTAVTAELEQAHTQYPYFFNAYLLSKRYAQQGDTVRAKRYAHKALGHDTPPELMLYQSLRNDMKAMLQEGYDASREPYITFDHNNLDLGSLPFQKDKEIVFTLKNTGHKPLQLKDVIVSCSCLSVNWPKKSIKPGETGEIKATYNIKKAGGFHQYAYVISNAVNSAVLLTIQGRVN